MTRREIQEAMEAAINSAMTPLIEALGERIEAALKPPPPPGPAKRGPLGKRPGKDG